MGLSLTLCGPERGMRPCGGRMRCFGAPFGRAAGRAEGDGGVSDGNARAVVWRNASGATVLEGPEYRSPTLAEVRIDYKLSSHAQKVAMIRAFTARLSYTAECCRDRRKSTSRIKDCRRHSDEHSDKWLA